MVWLKPERLSCKTDHAPEITLRELASPTLEEMRTLWASLPGGPVSTPFQTPEFLEAFAATQQTADDRGLVIASFSEGAGPPLMLLPLVRSRRGPMRVVGMPDFGLADQNGPVFSKDGRPAWAGAALEACFGGLTDVDLVDIRKLHPKAGECPNPLFDLGAAASGPVTRQLDLANRCAASSWGGKSVYKKTRSKFRKLAEAGVRLERAETADQRLSLLRALSAQRAERFLALGREDSLQRPERHAFYEALAGLHGSQTPVMALSLRRGDEVIAAMVLLRAGDQVTAVLVSIGDPRWHGLSPGMVLFAKAIEIAAAEGLRWFGFGTGEQEYKERFGGEEVETRRLLMPLNAAGRMFVSVRDARRSARDLLRIALGKPETGTEA